MDIKILHRDVDFRSVVPAGSEGLVRHVVIDVAGNTPTELERNAVDRAIGIAESAGATFVLVVYLDEGIVGETIDITTHGDTGRYIKQVTGYTARVLIKYVSKVGA